MKKLISLLAAGILALGIAGGASAAPGEPGAAAPPGKKGPKGNKGAAVGRRLHGLLAKLDLTPEQKKKVDTILHDARAELQKIPPAERREKGRAIQKSTRDKIVAVLTPTQQSKLKELIKAERAKRARAAGQGRPGKGKAAPRPAG